MRVLITGAGGFVGKYLVQHLLEHTPTIDLHATVHQTQPDTSLGQITWHSLDMRDENATRDLIKQIQPEQVYHLVGQAFVPRSFEAPWETLEINIRSQLNLFLACLAENIKPRILITASAEVYGAVKTIPIDEDTPLSPSSPYSVSKVTQDLLGLQYFLSHGLPVLRSRAFNHIGPGQSDRFVAPAFGMQIAKIEAGLQEPVLRVGDLSAKRDFTDVRDVVLAYRLMLEKGKPGTAYNIASGIGRSARELLDILLSYTTAKIEVTIDESRLRPNHIPILEGDSSRLRTATGWQPTISFEQSLRDVLDDCRHRVAQIHS